MPAQSATQYWQPDISSQPGSYYSFGQVPSHMGRPNFQTTIETHHDVDGIFDHFPSKYKLTSFMEQPTTTILPKQRVNKTKNKGKKANLSPLNLGGAFEDDNVEENNVTFLGSQFTGNFLMYENVDPTKVIANLVYKIINKLMKVCVLILVINLVDYVRRGNYVNLSAFLNASLAEMMNHVVTDYSSENEGIIRQDTHNDYTFNKMVEWAEQEPFEYEETKVSCSKIDLSSVLIQNNSSKEESFGGIISEEEKRQRQESLSYLHQMHKRKNKNKFNVNI
ncbi:hypothetical protein Tco_0879954 [Tanacetum coccineum]